MHTKYEVWRIGDLNHTVVKFSKPDLFVISG